MKMGCRVSPGAPYYFLCEAGIANEGWRVEEE
jgi:hypothetical protein